MDLEHEKRLSKVEERAASNTKRINELEERQDHLDRLAGALDVLATREERVESDVKEIKCDVKKMADKPGQRWDNLVNKIVWAVAAAFIGFILAHFGF